MKKIVYILLLAFLQMENVTMMAQFTMDFSDTSTYRSSCGSITPDHWKVSDDSCMVYTPILVAMGPDTINITFVVKINQSGNLGTNDIMYLYHRINQGGIVWDDTIYGGGMNSVYSITKTVRVFSTDRIQFNIIGKTIKNNKFWQIKSGEMNISNVIKESTLPINLLSFSADISNGATELTWITATEQNNDFFTIERNINGEGFKPIATIKGAGNSNQKLYYSYTDNQSVSAPTYYRLKQTDFDGTYTYSKPIAVMPDESMIAQFSLYPNPVTDDYIILEYNASAAINLSITISDNAGRKCHDETIVLEQGNHAIRINSLNKLKPGLYMASITEGLKPTNKRKMIIR